MTKLHEMVPDGTRCNVTGWGYLNEEGPTVPNILQLVTVPIVNSVLCNDTVPGVTESMICAGFLEGGKLSNY